MNIKTDQEAFEFAKEQLLNQKSKSFLNKGDGTCAYRGHSQKAIDSIEKQTLIEYKLNFDNDLIPEEDDQFWDLYDVLLYDTPRDAKCAVGHLIDDIHYDSNIEESDITNPGVIEAVVESNPNWIITSESKDMLGLMQTVHDRLPIEEWKDSFNKFQFHSNGEFAGVTGILV